MVTHTSILAWEIPRTQEPARLQSRGHKELDTTLQLNNSKDTICLFSSPNAQIYNRMWLTLENKTGQEEIQVIRVFIQLKSAKDLFCLTSFSSLGYCGHLSFLHCSSDLIFVYLFKKYISF